MTIYVRNSNSGYPGTPINGDYIATVSTFNIGSTLSGGAMNTVTFSSSQQLNANQRYFVTFHLHDADPIGQYTYLIYTSDLMPTLFGRAKSDNDGTSWSLSEKDLRWRVYGPRLSF